MAEQQIQQDDRENLSGMNEYQEYIDSQESLPEHKRDGYAERMYEIADRNRKEQKENF
jgi:hypothetical protein